MLFFRSEERVREWCEASGNPLRPRARIDQLWGLATAFYATRMRADARRPTLDEARAVLAGLDLRGEFWDPAPGRSG